MVGGGVAGNRVELMGGGRGLGMSKETSKEGDQYKMDGASCLLLT